MRDKIEWLISEYESAVDELTNDYRESKSMLNNSYRTGKIGVYSKVIDDLQALLEEGEDE